MGDGARGSRDVELDLWAATQDAEQGMMFGVGAALGGGIAAAGAGDETLAGGAPPGE